MRIKGIFFALLAATVLAGAFRAEAARRNFTVNGRYDRLNISGNVDVEYVQGNSTSIVATADPEVLNKLTVRVKNGTLVIYGGARKASKVSLATPAVSAIVVSGNADFEASRPLSSDVLSVTATGNAEMDFNGIRVNGLTLGTSGDAEVTIRSLSASGTTVSASGNSEVEISGNVNAMTVSASGNSEMDINGRVDRFTASATGNSEIDASGMKGATGTLSATGNSSASVPAGISYTTRGNASVTRR